MTRNEFTKEGGETPTSFEKVKGYEKKSITF